MREGAETNMGSKPTLYIKQNSGGLLIGYYFETLYRTIYLSEILKGFQLYRLD